MTMTPANSRTLLKSILFSFMTVVKAIVSAVRSFLFAVYYPKIVEGYYNDKVVSYRKEILADISTAIASSPDNLIRILEVGVGPGSNLDCLPKKCRLIALDKNVYFKKLFLKNLQKHPGIILETFLNECGEKMTSVPSNSIDVVVTSSIHCSVDNSKEVLKEINRVLVPGGRYYFFEHVLDEPNTVRYKWQTFINYIGMWKLVFHGCTFVDFEKEISKADFFSYKAKRYVFANESWTYYPVYLVASHTGGCAIKIKKN